MHRLIAGIGAASFASPASCHHAADPEAGAFELGLIAVLALGALLYVAGVRALWRKAGSGRGVEYADAIRFALGWTALAAALLSPIDELTDRSFALHMVQHEILMVVAAPLIVLGRPLEAFAWALSQDVLKACASVARMAWMRNAWTLLTGSLSAWVVHATALWIWHVPLFFKAALSSAPLHVLQHACFLVSALGFWWAAFGARERAPPASSVASLFTTMLHTSALGALLTFAPTAWYALGEAPAFGLTAIEDQELGGLIMWIPGGMAYMVAGLMVVRTWLNPSTSTAASQGR